MSDKLVCQMLEDPQSSELYEATTDAFDSLFHEILGIDDVANQTFRYDEIINSCKEDGSIYNVFYLDLVYNISELADWQETYNISGISEQVLVEVGNGITDLVHSMTIDNTTKDGINEIADQFSELTGSIFDNITNINISGLVPESDLNNVIAKLSEFADLGVDSGLIEQVNTSIYEIQRILNEDVEDHINQTINFVETMEEDFNYNSSCDVGCAVKEVLNLAAEATNIIDTTSRTEILNTTSAAINNITELGKKFKENLWK